jgi:Zn-dependent protease
MDRQRKPARAPVDTGLFGRSVRVGALYGIEIRLDPSVLIIFTLVVWVLGASVFPSWHPLWSSGLAWGTALSAGVIFLASLLAHEMAHSLVALRHGLRVPRITLFMLGGVAEMEQEPDTPRAEFLIAIAGPVMSLLLGVAFILYAVVLAPPEFTDLLARDREAALASLSPVTSLLLWLGSVNIVLAVFNMVPGFPLDGGRVLRAALWWFTGDLVQATRQASAAGRFFGWILILLGVLNVLGGAFQGLWLILIGWFLIGAATAGYSQLVMRRSLGGHPVDDVMRTHFETVDASMGVAEFIDDYLLRSNQRLWPVVSGGRLAGFATLESIRETPPEERSSRTLGEVMITDLDAHTLSSGIDAMQGAARLARGDGPMAVVRDGHVLGLFAQEDVVKWIALHPA